MTESARAPMQDLIICGAGPAGAALALLLAEYWPDVARITLIDHRDPAPAADAPRDARLIAISQGSRSTLERLGAWRDASATPIERIHVSHRGHFGRTLINRDDYGVPALGYVIAYADLVAQFDGARAAQRFTTIQPARVDAVQTVDDHVEVRLADGRTLQARYAVHAEGGLFSAQERRSRHRDYGQSALTAVVRATLPQPGVAWERFTEAGPIALLPLRQGAASPAAAHALVWCGNAADTERRQHADENAFLHELHNAFGDRLGRFVSVEARHSFVLGLNATEQPVDGRVFAIGNAAQTLHPVAGQGMNLALRDACSLAATLRSHFSDAPACAAAYIQARRFDRRATIGITDLLPRVFASRLTPLIAARGAVLTLLDLVPQTRHWMARQMMEGQR